MTRKTSVGKVVDTSNITLCFSRFQKNVRVSKKVLAYVASGQQQRLWLQYVICATCIRSRVPSKPAVPTIVRLHASFDFSRYSVVKSHLSSSGAVYHSAKQAAWVQTHTFLLVANNWCLFELAWRRMLPGFVGVDLPAELVAMITDYCRSPVPLLHSA